MLSVVAAVVLASGPKIIVLDVSATDAIYEDVSRGLADSLVSELKSKGLDAARIDEQQMLSVEDCRGGPCLGKVARENQAHIVITLDAAELPKSKASYGVAVTAMAGRNGMPLAGARYELKDGAKKKPKGLEDFVQKLLDLAAKFPQAKDGGVADAGAASPAP